MKILGLNILVGFIIGGCASLSPETDPDSYSREDMSIILTSNFNANQHDASQALKPSFAKFGAPKRYVAGNMSAVYENLDNRLYGFGDLHARFTTPSPIFWQIEGEDFAADVNPIKTVHMLYDKKDLTQLGFEHIYTETRRGKNFTVIERDLGERFVVSIYPTGKISRDADLKKISFKN